MKMQLLAIGALFVACGGGAVSGDAGTSEDAGADIVYGKKPKDAGAPDVAQEADVVKTPWDRMTSHGGAIIDALHLRAIYVGSGSFMPKNVDAYMAWMISSPDYWSLLAQYGVGYGTVLEGASMDASEFFLPGDVASGVVQFWTLDSRINDAIAKLPPVEGGAANAYIVFLPPGIDVDLGFGKSCTSFLGFHSSVALPYSLIPACGNSGVTISHELAEMVTDPNSGGWYSDADVNPAGGEIGDLCNFPTQVDNHYVTSLWSNADGDCQPL